MSRVAVTGSTGQLGSDVVEAFAGHAVTGLAHEDLDIRDGDAIRATFARLQPEIVVNTAAFHNVPRCETAQADAYAVNAIAPRQLAQACD